MHVKRLVIKKGRFHKIVRLNRCEGGNRFEQAAEESKASPAPNTASGIGVFDGSPARF